MKRHLKKDIHAANKHVHKNTISIIIREMQIKTTMRFHLTSVRMATIKKSKYNRHWQNCGEKGMLIPLLVGVETSSTIVEHIMAISKDIKTETLFNPAISLLGI